ncbi:MAG: YigZ family protein [Bacteroidota bacterium]
MTFINDKTFYQTIDKLATAEFKDRGSKFIAYAFPINTVDEFKKFIQQLKKEHAKAIHFCFAYRLGIDGNNFRTSDDGEPSGTAGKPILGQIDSKEIINVAVVVIRYWGGTLLGVPGLINAYKTTTSLALQMVPIIQKQIEVNYEIQFDYTQMNDIMMIMKKYNCTVLSQELQLFCSIKVGIPINRNTEVLYQLKELQNLEIKKCD